LKTRSPGRRETQTGTSILLAVFSLACATSGPFDMSMLKDSPSLHVVDFKHIRQKERYDCGEGALAIVLTYWGRPTRPEEIASEIYRSVPQALGTTAGDLKAYAEKAGFRAFLIRASLEELRRQIDLGRPAIVCRKILGGVNHYEVVVGYDADGEYMVVADPAGVPYWVKNETFSKRHKDVDDFAMLVAPPAGAENR